MGKGLYEEPEGRPHVRVDGRSLEIDASGALCIRAAGVRSEAIADGAVGSAAIADGAVGSAAIADGAVGSAAIADGAVTAPA